ncbi:uncharacterized protein DEA37_0005903 [Paragonimus westermani]|uniref:Uncharacterized protein n=1 Tax=Paragonimus westermani TaxID=34504 RepID=A0A5J4P533_9TREM|nr:uncharacterized protein DEA37_0005903 [Paragonimus westermani]
MIEEAEDGEEHTEHVDRTEKPEITSEIVEPRRERTSVGSVTAHVSSRGASPTSRSINIDKQESVDIEPTEGKSNNSHVEPMRKSSKNYDRPAHDDPEVIDVNGMTSVVKLREYFTNLSQPSSTNILVEPKRIRRRSYTIPKKSITPLQVNTNLNGEKYAGLNTSASVEELRQIFEHGEMRTFERTHSLGHTMSPKPSVDQQPLRPSRVHHAKSVEFFSRPPKYRTPSPRHQSNLPTPPPLPLPPSPELIEAHFRRDRRAPQRYINGKCRAPTSFVASFNQSAQPIISMGLPFRSRSLALDRLGDNHSDTRKLKKRYRAGSITQRSLSPVELPVRGRCSRRTMSHSSKSFQSYGVDEYERNNLHSGSGLVRPQTKIKTSDKSVQSPCRALVPTNANHKWSDTDVIRLSPNETDGVYVRSAVVYERVTDQSQPGGPKHYVTTYVVSPGPYPSKSTVQATNLWVAENALLSVDKDQNLPPYRTHTLSRPEPNYAQPPTESFGRNHSSTISTRQLSGRTRCTNQRPRSLTVTCSEPRKCLRVSTRPNTPQPLPTPPSASLHPYILKCASQDSSPDRSAQVLLTNIDKAVQCNSQRVQSSSPARSWSVKSLSPPPFRTPWLSSFRFSKSKLDDECRQHTDAETYPEDGCHNSSRSCPVAHKYKPNEERNRILSVWNSGQPKELEPFRMERARSRAARERREWTRRAETLSRERRAYHEMRGSWSPPYIKSPARRIKNDLEEDTEREIRNLVKQNRPLSPAPLPHRIVHVDHRSTQTPSQKDEEVQCGDPVRANKHELIDDYEETGVDTTPITENFDAKREFFEQLIKTNQMLARCSFCSDCYHCPPEQIPRYSSYSSWDSDLQNAAYSGAVAAQRSNETQTEFPVRTLLTRDQSESYDCAINYPVSKYAADVNFGRETTKPVRNYQRIDTVNEPIRAGPQQYVSSLYMSSQLPHSTRWDMVNNRSFDRNQNTAGESISMQHEYYAKPQIAMPKVAPNPPVDKETVHSTQYNRWEPAYLRHPTKMSHAELVHSPTATGCSRNAVVCMTRQDYSMRSGIHSPPCRFYTHNQQTSLESLHDVSTTSAADLAAYRGRVKQIVGELNERTFNRQNSPESLETYPPEMNHKLRRSLRYN